MNNIVQWDSENEVIQYAANLSELDYQRQRKELAKALGIGVVALDKVVRSYRSPSTMGRIGRDMGRTAIRATVYWTIKSILNSMFGNRSRRRW